MKMFHGERCIEVQRWGVVMQRWGVILLFCGCGGSSIKKGDFDLPPPGWEGDRVVAEKKQRSGFGSSQKGGKEASDKALNRMKTSVIKDRGFQKALRKMVQKSVKLALQKDHKDGGERENFGHCIEGEVPTSPFIQTSLREEWQYSPMGQEVRFAHRQVGSRGELREILGLGGGVKVPWQSVITKAHVADLADMEISRESRYYFFLVDVKNPAVVMKDVRLSDGAYALYKNQGAEAFYKRCGRKAHIGYQSGGYFVSVIRIGKTSESVRESIDSLIKMSGFGFGIDGQIKMKEDADVSQLRVDIVSRWQGGKGVSAPTSIQVLKKVSTEWPQKVSEHGVVTEVISMDFDELLTHLHDPYHLLVLRERNLYRQELERLSQIKKALVSMYPRVKISKKRVRTLEGLLKRLSRNLERCEKALKLSQCMDTALLYRAKRYRVMVKKEHAQCGVRAWKREWRRHHDCGQETCMATMMREDQSCGVRAYQKGKIFSEERRFVEHRVPKRWDDEQDLFPAVCQGSGVERRYTLMGQEEEWHLRPCRPGSDACLDQPRVRRIFHRYRLSCYGRMARFGVERYKKCDTKVERKCHRLCEVRTEDPAGYHRCQVDIEQ